MRIKNILVCAILLAVAGLLTPVRAADLNAAAPFVRVAEQGARHAAAMDAEGRLHIAAFGAGSATGTPVRFTTAGPGPAGASTTAQPGPAATVADLVGVHNEQRPLALVVAGQSLYLAYNLDDRRICYQRRGVSGGAWSAPACVEDPVSERPAADVDIAVLADGTVALAWQRQRLGVALHRNGAWQRLPDPSAGQEREPSEPRLAVVGGDLTLLWVQRRADGPGNSVRTELLGRTYAGGSWGATTSVSGFDAQQGQWQVRNPSVVVGQEGKLHLAYLLFAPGEDYSGPRNRIIYRSGTLAALGPGEGIAQAASAPSLAVRNGVVDLAWYGEVGPIVGGLRVQNQEILWSRRAGAWSEPRNISYTAGPSQQPSIFIAPGDRTVVVWQDWLDGPAVFAKQTVRPGAWATETPVDQPAVSAYVERADRPVAVGAAARSWLWGPSQWIAQRESYVEAPDASRPVFYYDKARVEVGDPNRAPGDPAYFTNGLLVTELASGRVQYGDQIFVGREPAAVPVVGDSAGALAPTYASFRSLVYIPEIGQRNQAADRTGQAVDQCLSRAGAVATCSPTTRTTYGHFVAETGHNIAQPFWAFLNQSGPVWQNGRVENGPVFPWVTAMGYPIAEPYWTRATVRGVERDVLVQLFQRRVLSYTPGNPAGFEVEMGNVGQHYYTWRHGATPWVK